MLIAKALSWTAHIQEGKAMTALVSVYSSKIMHLKHKGEITYFGPSLVVICIIIAGFATFVFWQS